MGFIYLFIFIFIYFYFLFIYLIYIYIYFFLEGGGEQVVFWFDYYAVEKIYLEYICLEKKLLG